MVSRGLWELLGSPEEFPSLGIFRLRGPQTESWLDLSRVYHKFIGPHEGLRGDTPSGEARIGVEGDDKWLTVIQSAAQAVPRNEYQS